MDPKEGSGQGPGAETNPRIPYVANKQPMNKHI